MSTSRDGVREHVRELLGDMNPAEPAIGQFRYNEVIDHNVYLVADRAKMPRSSVQSVSLSAGTYEYIVAATASPDPYSPAQSVSLVLLNSTGAELAMVPWEQFNAYYKQDSAAPVSSGRPCEYTARENTTHGLVLRFGPTPSATDTAKVHLSLLPPNLLTDSTAIPFDHGLARALELVCAAEVVLLLSKEKRAAMGLSDSVAGRWVAASDELIRGHNRRFGDLGTRQNRILRGGGRRVRVGS